MHHVARRNWVETPRGVGPGWVRLGDGSEPEADRVITGTVDASRTLAPEFPIRSQAYVKAQFFCTTRPSKKLADKFLGTYEVIAQLGTHSIMLCLPDSLCAVHLVFHVSMLEPTTLNAIPD